MLAALAAALVAPAAGAAPLPAEIEPLKLRKIATLDQPVDLAVRAGDRRLFIAERTGRVRVLDGGRVLAAPFLDLSRRVSTTGEVGLLGIAFSPAGDRLYAYYTGGGNRGRLGSWALTGDQIDLASEITHLVLAEPSVLHNGGQLAFGPDGMLYWALGDGRVDSNGQDPTTRRGSILRIDPTPAGPAPYAIPAGNPFAAGGGAPEVWAYGLRNPWRFSFDRQNGDMWIADVGESQREEINHLPAGTSAGANLGWAALEGTLPRRRPIPPGLTPPVHEYERDVGTSVTGGFVYRGRAIESLRGLYVFGDYGRGFVAALGLDASGNASVRDLGLSVPAVVSFGQDNAGELYALAVTGEVYKIVSTLTPSSPLAPPAPPTPAGASAPGASNGGGRPAGAEPPRKLVRIVSASVRGRGRVLKLRLSCSRKAMQACTGRVVVETKRPRRVAVARRATISLAGGRFRKLAAGKKRIFKLRLRRPARELLASASARRLPLTITVRARDGQGLKRTTTTQRRVRVSGP